MDRGTTGRVVRKVVGEMYGAYAITAVQLVNSTFVWYTSAGRTSCNLHLSTRPCHWRVASTVGVEADDGTAPRYPDTSWLNKRAE